MSAVAETSKKSHEKKQRSKRKEKERLSKREKKLKQRIDGPEATLAQQRRELFLRQVDASMLVPDTQKVQLTWSAISYRVPAEKRRFARCRGYGDMKEILSDVSGYVAPVCSFLDRINFIF